MISRSIDNELQKRGWEEVSGGNWSHRKHEDGEHVVTRIEAVALMFEALERQRDDAVEISNLYGSILEEIRVALGGKLKGYDKLAEMVKRTIGHRNPCNCQVSHDLQDESAPAKHPRPRSNLRFLLPEHVKEQIRDRAEHQWLGHVLSHVDTLTDELVQAKQNVADHEQRIGGLFKELEAVKAVVSDLEEKIAILKQVAQGAKR